MFWIWKQRCDWPVSRLPPKWANDIAASGFKYQRGCFSDIMYSLVHTILPGSERVEYDFCCQVKGEYNQVYWWTFAQIGILLSTNAQVNVQVLLRAAGFYPDPSNASYLPSLYPSYPALTPSLFKRNRARICLMPEGGGEFHRKSYHLFGSSRSIRMTS